MKAFRLGVFLCLFLSMPLICLAQEEGDSDAGTLLSDSMVAALEEKAADKCACEDIDDYTKCVGKLRNKILAAVKASKAIVKTAGASMNEIKTGISEAADGLIVVCEDELNGGGDSENPPEEGGPEDGEGGEPPA